MFLALDLDFGRAMAQVDAGAGFVDLLPAVSRAANKALDEILVQDPQLLHAELQGGFFMRADHILMIAYSRSEVHLHVAEGPHFVSCTRSSPARSSTILTHSLSSGCWQ